ncbi:hypothetical protein L3Y34_016055 [Caenorhabditis briggsae]|uniref:Uncharacterized protein n=1 Tax=Caenorhabditis briggsae TaxID=6238 RepID=A0AAE9DW55_CAEBR|nr:hypothetical protein L3Y34_016055 [Caenorhabditis briggsae]
MTPETEEDARKSMRVRKKRSFGDDFVDPTSPDYAPKSAIPKRKRESTPRQEPEAACSRSSSSSAENNIHKILANYDKEMNISVESDGNRRSGRVVRPSAKMAMVEQDGQLAVMKASDQNEASNKHSKKPELTMSGLKEILNRFPVTDAPPEPVPLRVSYSSKGLAQSLTPEEDKKLEEEAQALCAKIRDANAMKILANRASGKQMTGERRAAHDAELMLYATKVKNSKFCGAPLSSSTSSASTPPPPEPRKNPARATRQSIKFYEGFDEVRPFEKRAEAGQDSPIEPKSEAPAVQESSISNQRLPENAQIRAPVVQNPPVRRPVQNHEILHQIPTHLRPVETAAAPQPSVPAPVSQGQSPLKVVKLECDEESMEIEIKPELFSPVPRAASEESDYLGPPSLSPAVPIQRNSQTIAHAPLLPKKPLVKMVPAVLRPPAPPITTRPQWPPGSTTETTTIIRGPDGRILSKRTVIAKINDRRAGPDMNVPVRRVGIAPPPGMQFRGHSSRLTNWDFAQMEQLASEVGKKKERQGEEDVPPEKRDNQTLADVPPHRWKFPVAQVPGPQLHEAPALSKRLLSPSGTKREIARRRRKSISPRRLFLGAEEPIKDLPDSNNRSSWFTQRKVSSFGKDQLKAFGKRPAGSMANDKIVLKGRNLSNVLIEAQDTEEEEEGQDDVVKERVKELVELKKAKFNEQIRQQEANAQKLIFNMPQVFDYMHSEKFKKMVEPPEGSTKFRQLLNSPGSFEKIPEFSDSLLHSNPDLYDNLERIWEKKQKERKQKPQFPTASRLTEEKFLKFRERWSYKPGKPCGPVQIVNGIEKATKESTINKVLTGTVRELDCTWKSIKSKIPEVIECHLCFHTMKLCMRKSSYRGEVREYPAYRCTQKGCQTFCSVRKVLGESLNQQRAAKESNLVEPKQEIDDHSSDNALQIALRILAECERASYGVEQEDDTNPGAPMGMMSSEDVVIPMEPQMAGREKRIRRSKFADMSRDFVCETSAAEIARKDQEEGEEEEEEGYGEEDEEQDDYPMEDPLENEQRYYDNTQFEEIDYDDL